MSIKIIIADDHPVVIEGVKSIISAGRGNIKIIGEYSNGRELLKDFARKRADVYILNISMPVLNGLETAEKLVKMYPEVKIIILSMYDNRGLVEKAVKCGVKGYVLKENAADEIVAAVIKIHKGGSFFSKQVKKYVTLKVSRKNNKRRVFLTGREKEILNLIARGLSNKEMAGRLGISLNTVHSHRKKIMKKLDIHKQADIIHYAIRVGISKL